jgi:hypothetical protein
MVFVGNRGVLLVHHIRHTLQRDVTDVLAFYYVLYYIIHQLFLMKDVPPFTSYLLPTSTPSFILLCFYTSDFSL